MKTICTVILAAFLIMGCAHEQKKGEPLNYIELHKELIFIDGAVPLLIANPTGPNPEHIDWYKNGGATALSVTVSGATDDASKTANQITYMAEQILQRDDLSMVYSSEDILKAKAEGKMGIFYHFQGCEGMGEDIKRVWHYKQLGVGMMQLVYNKEDQFGYGSLEEDKGLKPLGKELVTEMNKAKIIVDLAHTGPQTSMDIIRASSSPVVASHSNCRCLIDSPRNLPDSVLRAIADNRGVAGVVAWPSFVSNKQKPHLDDLLDMVDKMVEVMGIDHVAFGLDYSSAIAGIMPDEEVLAVYDDYVEKGIFDTRVYKKPPYYFPEGIEDPRKLVNLTKGLVKRGYNKKEILKLMGGNWMRVMNDVWGE